MADRKFDPARFGDYTERNRVIRQRNIALGLVLAFFVALFFAITVVKMRHVQLPHNTAAMRAAASAAGSTNGQ